jgi:hypothetical protein
MGFVKPNAGAMVLIDTSKEEINNLTKEDMVIFWGGTNDIARNASSNKWSDSYNEIFDEKSAYKYINKCPSHI